MVEVQQAVQRGARAGERVALRLVTDALHRANVRRHRGSRLPLDDVGREVVATLARGDIAMVPLDDLGLGSTRDMELAGRGILAELEAEHGRGHGTGGMPLIRTATGSAALRAWATESSIVAIAQHHIGLPVAFQGVHARLELANDVPRTTELWHRDIEDRRMLKCFVHLNEVTVDHGPFEYVRDADVPPATIRRIRGAVRRARGRGHLGLRDEQMAELVDPGAWRSSPVPARTVVFADTAGMYHHGRRRSVPRPALFFVYTSAFPRRPEHCHQYWDDRHASDCDDVR